ncbi:MAG: alpha/beta hydrolase family protein [Promethearchaeota archaeon]
MKRDRLVDFVNTKLFRRKYWAIVTLGGFLACFTVTAVLNYAVVDASRQTVYFESEGDTIEGLIVDPASSPYEKKPFLVLVHGFMCSKEYMQSFSIEFAKRGILTMSISMPGHGMSTGASEGTLKSPSAVTNGIDYILDRADELGVDPAKIGIIGHSMGAMTVLKAGFRDARVNATVAIAAPSWNASTSDPTIALLNSVDTSKFKEAIGFWFDSEPMVDFINQSMPRNFFFVVGDRDELVYEADARALLEFGTGIPRDKLVEGEVYTTASGTNRKFQTYSWIEHNQESFDARVITDTINWVESSLGLTNEDPIRLTEPYRFGFMMAGFLLGLLSSLPVMSYASSFLLPGRRDLDGKCVRLGGEGGTRESRLAWKDIAITLGAYVVVGGLLGGALNFARHAKPYLSLMGYMTIPAMLGGALLLIPVVYALSRTVWKPLKLDQGRWFRGESVRVEVLYGFLAGVYLLLVVNLGFTPFWINLAPLGPRFAPFFLGLLLCLPIAFVDGLFFKGYLLDRLQNRWGFWKAGVVEGVTSAAVKGVTFGLAFVLYLPANPFNSAVLPFLLLAGICFLLVGALDILGRWAFFQTRSVVAYGTLMTIVYAFVFTQIFPMI